MNRYFIVLFSFALVVFSCVIQEKKPLYIAAHIMDERPDSAMEILLKINPDELKTAREEAEFALYKTQALYKNDSVIKSDSLIKVAVEYFDEDEISREKMLANYYMGCINYSNDSILKALRFNLVAKKVATELKENYYLGLINFNLLDIYNYVHNNNLSLKISEEAIEAFAKAGKESHLEWARYYRANSLHNLGSLEESLEEIAIVLRGKEYQTNTEFYNNCQDLLINCKSKIRDSVLLTKFDSLFSKIDIKNAEDNLSRIQRLISDNELDSAKIFLENFKDYSSQYNRNIYDYLTAKYVFKSGEKDEGFKLLNSAFIRYDSLFKSYSQMGISTLQSDFYHDEAVKAREKERATQRNFLALFLLIATASALAIIYLRHQIKKKEEALAEALEMATTLRKEIMSGQQATAAQKRKISELLHTQFDTLAELCASYYESPGEKTTGENLTRFVKDTITSLRAADKQTEILHIVDGENCGLLSRLYAETAATENALTEREKELLLYLTAVSQPSPSRQYSN